MSDLTPKLAAMKTSIQAMVQSIIQANLSSQTAENALKFDGKTYAQVLEEIMGATSLTIADVAAALAAHEADTENPHGVTKAQVGLALVENFAMALKGDFSGLTPAQIDAVTNSYVNPSVAYYLAEQAIAQIIGTAPETLDTIQEIAAALNNDPDIVNTLTTQIGTKASTTDLNNAVATINAAIAALTKADVGLGNVDNFITATATEADDDTNVTSFMNPAMTHRVVNAASDALYTDVELLIDELTSEFNNGAAAINPS